MPVSQYKTVFVVNQQSMDHHTEEADLATFHIKVSVPVPVTASNSNSTTTTMETSSCVAALHMAVYLIVFLSVFTI